MKTTTKTFSGLLRLGFVLFVLSASTQAQTTTCSSTGVPIIALGTLGGDFSEAIAINNRGQVLGDSRTALGQRHAFLWHKGEMEDLETLGGDFSFGRAINNLGQVTGESSNASGEIHAFLWQKGKMRDLGTLGGAFSEAVAINERGQVVGSSSGQAVLWDTRSKDCTGASE